MDRTESANHPDTRHVQALMREGDTTGVFEYLGYYGLDLRAVGRRMPWALSAFKMGGAQMAEADAYDARCAARGTLKEVFGRGLEVDLTSEDLIKHCTYGILEDMFYGMHNIQIPDRMVYIQNGYETAAQFFAAGNLKRWDRSNMARNLPREFSGLVSSLNGFAFKFPSIRNLRKTLLSSANHEAGPGKLRKRLEVLSLVFPEEAERVVESFHAPYRPSIREQPTNPNAFYDPNVDGNDKGIYARAVYDCLQRAFNRANAEDEELGNLRGGEIDEHGL